MKQLNRSLFFVAMAVLLGLAVAVPCSYVGQTGTTLYQTGFERPDFCPGTLVGHEGWVGVPILSPNAAVVSTHKPWQGKQSVLVRGKDLVPDTEDIETPTNGYYSAIGSYRHPLTPSYDTGGTQTVRVSAHVMVDGPHTSHKDNFFSASIVAIAQGVEDG